ncbi:MAG: alpha/beta hydrolase [Planifilum fimeticola]|jgi:epsilon-lactone hydrolase
MASPQSEAIRQMLREQKEAAKKGSPSIEEQRRQLDYLGSFSPVESDVTVEKTRIAGVRGEWISAPNARKDRVLFYLHGGAYCLGSCDSHRGLASRLARACESRALVIEYRLAPEHPFPAALEDSTAVYRELIRSGVRPENMVIGGDSAGGGLTMATLLTLRDEGDPLPASAVLLSPWTDLEGTGESMKTRADVEPWLDPEKSHQVAKLYLRDLDPRHPLVSPIYADLRGLPPMLVHVGNDECLLDDSVRLVERAKKAGVETEFKIWDEMWHVFHGFPIPEARQAIEEIGAFVRARLP